MKTGISVSDAQALVLDQAAPTPVVRVPLLDALGLILAEDAASDIDLPPFDNSAMDGYAVRAADVAGASDASPVALIVTEEIAAGDVATQAVNPGAAMRIFTGAPIPDGADAIVIQENTTREGDTVHVRSPSDAGAHIRRAGEDVRQGEMLLPAGALVTSRCIGLLAGTGHPFVAVHRPPTVAILSTGEELVDIDETPGAGQIRSTNNHALMAQVTICGASGVNLGIARDTADSVRAHLAGGADADILVTSGGVSVGEHDIVKDVLTEMGMTLIFWRVMQKPGNPLAFGVRRREEGTPQLIFGLPGNPAASQVCFEEYVRPAIRKMLGFDDARLKLPRVRATLESDIGGTPGRQTFVRGIVEETSDGYRATSAGGQSSGMLLSMAKANALLIVPPDVTRIEAGAAIEADLLPTV